MKIYKLKVLYYSDDSPESSLKDLYLNVESISGFYIIDKSSEDEHIEGDFVTLCHEGQWTTVLQQKHITDYLTENFVEKSNNK